LAWIEANWQNGESLNDSIPFPEFSATLILAIDSVRALSLATIRNGDYYIIIF